jgi:HlyD family secretion protein
VKRFVVLMVAVVAASAGCGKHASKPRRGQTVERLAKVEVVHPTRMRLIRKLDLAATVEAMQKVDMVARVPGIVMTLPRDIDIGRPVKKDEKLIELEVPDLRADRVLKAELLAQAKGQEDLAGKMATVADKEVEEVRKEKKKFEAEAEFAKKRLARIAQLVRERAQDPLVEQEAQKQSDAAAAAVEANDAKAAKQAAKADAAKTEQLLAGQRVRVATAELAKIDRQLEFAVVRAPFDGVITKRWVDSGATIKDPGTNLLTVMQLDRVRVLIDVPQRDVPLLDVKTDKAAGDLAEVRLPVASDGPGGLWRGVVTRVGQSLDPVTRTMRAEIELANPDGKLRPGMFGSAMVIVEDLPGVLTVPASALVRRGEGVVEVFVVYGASGEGADRRGVLKRVPVTLGIDDGRVVHIVSGLSGNELVVARGASVMRADDEVLAIDAP